MAKGRDRFVYRTPEGWANKRVDADKASSLHDTQQQASDSAKRMLQNQGGGELSVQGRDGKIRSKDTIAPGHESKVRDTEH